MSIGGDVLLTRANRQRYKIPIYNLTTGQPLRDVKGGNLAVNFDNSAFHSLFPPPGTAPPVQAPASTDVEKDGEYGTGDCNAEMADWLFILLFASYPFAKSDKAWYTGRAISVVGGANGCIQATGGRREPRPGPGQSRYIG